MTVKKFNYTGALQVFPVPDGVSTMFWELWGGSSPYFDSNGNDAGWRAGGKVTGHLACSPGDVLYPYIGGDGTAPSVTPPKTAPYNGGGLGGSPNTGYIWCGGSGAGAVDVRRNGTDRTNRIMCAGGAGGPGSGNRNNASAHSGDFLSGGLGGNPGGGDGSNAGYNDTDNNVHYVAGSGGHGASVAAPGSGGAASSPQSYYVLGAGLDGNGAVGGSGGVGNTHEWYNGGGGGGGGGWMGGGGGSGFSTTSTRHEASGSGGGGSSASGSLTGAVISQQKITKTIDSGYSGKNGFARATYHLPPDSGTPSSPVANKNIDTAKATTFTWDYSTDEVDSQAGANGGSIRWRLGSSDWTTIASTGDQQCVVAAGYFNAYVGDTIEWQVLAQDDANVSALNWSSSAFFTVIQAPATPVIVSPAAGGAVSASPYNVDWTTSNQGSYQIQVAPDVAGVADLTNLYYDSDEIIDSIDTNQLVYFDDPGENNSTVHVRVRIRDKTTQLWSAWADNTATVSYVPPAVPTLNIAPNTANLQAVFTVTNPAAAGGAPAAAYNDIYAIDPNGTEAYRIATNVPPNGSFTYLYAQSGMSFYAVAVATNGTNAKSATTSMYMVVNGVWLMDPDDSTTLFQCLYNDSGASETYDVEVTLNSYAGREFPVADFGEGTSQTLQVSLTHIDEDGGTQQKLRNLVESRKIVLYRDKKMRKLYGVIGGHPITDGLRKGDTQITFTRCDYDESV